MAFIDNVKPWFKTYLKPTQAQFYRFFEFIRWKDEKIPVNDIAGLNNLLIAKADKQAFNTHLQDEIVHLSENDRENWNGKLDKTGTAINSLNADKLGNKPPEYYAVKSEIIELLSDKSDVNHKHDDLYLPKPKVLKVTVSGVSFNMNNAKRYENNILYVYYDLGGTDGSVGARTVNLNENSIRTIGATITLVFAQRYTINFTSVAPKTTTKKGAKGLKGPSGGGNGGVFRKVQFVGARNSFQEEEDCIKVTITKIEDRLYLITTE
ncbi:hypothetical protein [Tenacibaculum piscium]|uniref:hypothetical protein n=1 Tax=Tenacibaculum piscium TaxID=1458515 RepID=UPI001F34CAAC|nr:hypothetical protein [Tenacibaculum piscium]